MSNNTLGKIGAIAFVMGLSGCGTKAKEDSTTDKTVTATGLVSDPQLSGSIVNATHGDAISAASDQTSGSASLTLLKENESKSDSDDDKSSVTKACAVSGASAVVTITSTIDKSKTSTSKSGTVTVARTHTGSGSLTRTWSRTDGTAVVCNSAAKGAVVDFKNPNGLKLDASFERSRESSTTFTGPKVTRTSTKSFKASGKRSTTWSSNDASADDASTYVRNKSVVISDVKHDLSMTDKNGNTVASSLAMSTTAEKPLVVKVERSVADNDVVSKTIVSGEIVTKKDADAVITTNYTNLKISFESDECKLVSGSATIVVKNAAGETLKTLNMGVDADGDAELKDDAGTAVEGFALDDCDAEDLKI